jgi:Immunity protein 27
MNDVDKHPTRVSGNEGQAFAKKNLVTLKIDSVKWRILWKNPQTGEFWKEYFPHSEMHGGGPSEFVKIAEEEAKSAFGSW